ncbi:methyltransferase [Nocardioides baekrokdamisoli]|uniref:Methyltransferase n=1 Tax=Nocardioides baekrokdamisoli TaxID=1804624 RepID=A0A3G9J356_9ACTN|nr:class I SAM-dependent methyltransferase [Nocardioides baekrokdamisoli]BBH18048.1 methyltransferase [Nocardioides baekrokdamisoli]
MDLDTFGWLLTEPGQRLLVRAAEVRTQGDLRAHDLLRREASAEQVAVTLTQVVLREKAVAKFGDLAGRMYFTPDGLEQATRLAVARHRAGRLNAFVTQSLIDLGCSIGGDLIASAEQGITVAGVDLDPVRVAVAQANLDALGLAGAVMVADATTVDTSPFSVAFADPARRGARGRVFNADGWEPPWPFVESLLRRTSCVKVAPGIPHDLIPDGVEAEWVSDRGEVKEAALWSGGLATVRRRATVLGDGGLATLTDEDDPVPTGSTNESLVRDVGEYLYEPDGAVIRAGLVTAVAAGVGGGLIDAQIAYVTSDSSFRTPFARGYRVIEELPYREKQLKAALRERGIGRLTIKKRGVDIVPETLRKRLQLSGPEEGTIVLTRVRDGGSCWLVEPF